ncbi:hypothetical protein MMC16_004047 [Acarospora aff. strigata]|nr:hypothetical protein [Acarospora aff. strigata]
MEKYSQYRDRGSGIAPFFPIPTQPSGIYLPLHIFLFLFRLPLLLTVTLSYFIVLQWLPIGSLGKKACLWSILGVPGVWWIDLQIDGVRKGYVLLSTSTLLTPGTSHLTPHTAHSSLAKHHKDRFPQPSSIIASSSTSPIDALYLAAIFDPIFTASYPTTRQVQRITLLQALLRTFSHPQSTPPPNTPLTDLTTLLKAHPTRVIVVFPECTTTNGRGILQFSPSLLTAPPTTKIFPLSLRYTPGDITTAVPGAYFSFLWNLLSKPTHCIRVRIAENVYNTPTTTTTTMAARVARSSYATNFLDTLQDDTGSSSTDTLLGSEEGDGGLAVPITADERRVLDKVAEALARLGRVKRVGLGVKEKAEFVRAWTRQRRRG